MKRRILILSILAASCSTDKNVTPPADLIPREKMISLIVDLQVLQAHYERHYADPYSYSGVLDSSSQFIFDRYAVTKNQFDMSFTYYAGNIDTIYSIYESALDTINFRINQPN